jgi:hypothetical protein
MLGPNVLEATIRVHGCRAPSIAMPTIFAAEAWPTRDRDQRRLVDPRNERRP